MTSRPIFNPGPFLPAPQNFHSHLEALLRYIKPAAALPVDDVLRDFFSRPIPARAFHITGVHHVAAYLGDHRKDEEVERWIDFLGTAAEVRDLTWGPSYIAPRHHGTSGYWISCALAGIRAELFTNRHMGPWRSLPLGVRAARMSHFAARVEAERHVKPLLDYFSHYPRLLLLAYSPRDQLGHTYGHLFNQDNDRVLELVHSEEGMPDERST